MESISDFHTLHKGDRTYYGSYCYGCKSIMVKKPYVGECGVTITYGSHGRHLKVSKHYSKS